MKPTITLIFALFVFRVFAADSLQEAKSFLHEQEEGKAIQTFLNLLEQIPFKPSEGSTPEFFGALQLYLDPSSPSPKETSLRILEKYPAKSQEADVTFIIAAAFANIGNYDQFFDLFYEAYQKQPDHFLAYKAKANLYIKLFELAPTPQLKEQLRSKIIENLQKSMDRYAKDQGLYAMIISFAPQDKRKEVITKTINAIITKNVQVARHEIDFYVKNALSIKDYALARRFIEKAKEWYPYSRSIEAAEKFLGDN